MEGEAQGLPLQTVSYDNLSFANSTQPPPFSRTGGKDGIGGEQDRLILLACSKTAKLAVSAAPPSSAANKVTLST